MFSVPFSHLLGVPRRPERGGGRIPIGGHLSQTKMGPQVQNPKGKESNGSEISDNNLFVLINN